MLETNQSNDLTVLINPASIYHTAQRNQRELQLAHSGYKLPMTTLFMERNPFSGKNQTLIDS